MKLTTFNRAIAVHMLATLCITPVIAYLMIQHFFSLFKLNQQELHWTTAASLANHLEQSLPTAPQSIAEAIHYAAALNRDVDYYLLDPHGSILESSISKRELSINQIAVAELRQLAHHVAPQRNKALFGTDPAVPGDPAPVSAASLYINKQRHFIYAVLVSQHRSAYYKTARRTAYVLAGIITIVIMALGLVGGSALASVSLRRFLTQVEKVLRSLQDGDYSARLNLNPLHEYAHVAAPLNEVAESYYRVLQEQKRAEQERRELISNISHDLNTPLASALGYTRRAVDSLSPDDVLSPSGQRCLKIAISNLEFLERLIRELFEVAKLDARTKGIDAREFSLLDLITEEIFVVLRPLAEEKKVRLTCDCSESDVRVRADESLLLRAIINLVENGIRYNRQGGEVCVRLKTNDCRVLVEVQDTGIGIPTKDLSSVFRRFYRGDEARQKGEGTGLGLAIVKKVLELHGEDIAVDSKPNEGTCFSFSLERV